MRLCVGPGPSLRPSQTQRQQQQKLLQVLWAPSQPPQQLLSLSSRCKKRMRMYRRLLACDTECHSVKCVMHLHWLNDVSIACVS